MQTITYVDNASSQTWGTPVILGFYLASSLLGMLVPRPRFVFWTTVLFAFLGSVVLFRLGVYLEGGGLAHMLPFAFIARWMAKRRQSSEPMR